MTSNNEENPVLFPYFEKSANVLLANYDRSGLQKASDNLGTNRENFCELFLQKILPTRLSYGKGEIWDSRSGDQGRTGQLDLIIYRDDAPKLTFGGRETYLVEGVFSVIEVKSNLNRDKLKEAGNTLEKVKNLKIKKPNVQVSMGLSIDRPLRIVFAYEGATWDTLLSEVGNQAWYDLFDLICILERGVYIKKGNLINWNNDNPYLIIDGKAASLGYLYFYLATYCQGFVSNRIDLKPYFVPFNKWKS